jgi:hypothetical protein
MIYLNYTLALAVVEAVLGTKTIWVIDIMAAVEEQAEVLSILRPIPSQLAVVLAAMALMAPVANQVTVVAVVEVVEPAAQLNW